MILMFSQIAKKELGLGCSQSVEMVPRDGVDSDTEDLSKSVSSEKMAFSASQINPTPFYVPFNSACLKICLFVPFLLFPVF